MQGLGLLMFVAAVPLALLGMCDPKTGRGSIIAFGAALMGPIGLVIAAA